MAGSEVVVSLDGAGYPPEVVDVDGHSYLLAVQSPPVVGRPWRYTIMRTGDLCVVDGGGASG